MCHAKIVEKIKTLILCSITSLTEMVEKYDRARQATDNNIQRHMQFTCWINKVTDTQSEYVILIDFPWPQWLGESTSIFR